jgi:alkylmercury lyase
MTTTSTPGMLAAELAAATPRLDQDEQHVALTLYRLLADAQPVDRYALAARAGLEPERVRQALARWPGVYSDDEERIIGFVGLSIRPMAHRLIVEGRVLYAWCAWDTLFLPELLGRRAQVESQCPTTQQPISLSVEGTHIDGLRPPEAVLSFLHRNEAFDADVIATFCHYVHFFASPAAAAAWTAQHDGTFTISLADGMEIARLTNRARYSCLLAA